jgi:tRNA pseudouridine38-40 synthase
MRNIKLILAYDGGRFCGWQRQGNTANTIQAILEEAVSKVIGESVEVNGAGRTDAGVHALGQAASFKTSSDMAADEIASRANKALPSDIVIREASDVPERFHARDNAAGKTYVYKSLNRPTVDPFVRKYSYWLPERLDTAQMRRAGELFKGSHDFKAFSSGRSKKSTVRTIYSFDFEEKDGYIAISYRGDGFLYNMVRIMTGTLIEVGRGVMSLSDVSDSLDGGSRLGAGFTAPPHGLFLAKVYY